ncbi:hypothetical protein MMC14_007316 [Varicellaria rhodocarpa]|nr:hypothetical protein [Varicellaria rhodocarpa]
MIKLSDTSQYKAKLYSLFFFWAIIESSLCIVAACLPSLRKVPSKKNLIRTVRSAMSLRTLRSYASRPSMGRPNISEDRPIGAHDIESNETDRATFRDGFEMTPLPKVVIKDDRTEPSQDVGSFE